MILKNKRESFLKITIKTAWTRLCNSAGTEWELSEDEALALKHVEVICQSGVHLFVHCTYSKRMHGTKIKI
jgi:hypothetical protein